MVLVADNYSFLVQEQNKGHKQNSSFTSHFHVSGSDTIKCLLIEMEMEFYSLLPSTRSQGYRALFRIPLHLLGSRLVLKNILAEGELSEEKPFPEAQINIKICLWN